MCLQLQRCSTSTWDPGISHPISFCWTKALFHSLKASAAFTLPQEAFQEECSDVVFVQENKSAGSWQLTGVRDVGKA